MQQILLYKNPLTPTHFRHPAKSTHELSRVQNPLVKYMERLTRFCQNICYTDPLPFHSKTYNFLSYRVSIDNEYNVSFSSPFIVFFQQIITFYLKIYVVCPWSFNWSSFENVRSLWMLVRKWYQFMNVLYLAFYFSVWE